jgi:ribosome-binding factor A
MTRSRGGRTSVAGGGSRHYPRMARVNEVLREVLAEEMEEVVAGDARLELLTVTAVECDPDLRHAKVYMASLSDEARTFLSDARARLQAAVAHQVRLKRTPQLSFEVDPAITYGARVEEVIRAIHAADSDVDASPRGTGVDATGPDGPRQRPGE